MEGFFLNILLGHRGRHSVCLSIASPLVTTSFLKSSRKGFDINLTLKATVLPDLEKKNARRPPQAPFNFFDNSFAPSPRTASQPFPSSPA